MNVRTTLLAASVALLAFAGCGGGRDDGNDAGCTTCSLDGGSDSGTLDAGSDDAGTDAGSDSGTDAGTDAGSDDAGSDAGICEFIEHTDGGLVDISMDQNTPTEVTIAQLRYGNPSDGGSFIPYKSHAKLTGVVVQTIDYQNVDGDAHFWVVDPNDPTSGFWIYKRDSDEPYTPAVGDVVDVDGFFNTDPQYYVTSGYRFNLANLYNGGVAKTLAVTKTGTTTPPPDNAVDVGCTFDAQDGHRYFPQDKQAFAGTRVHFNGPITLTNPDPIPMGNVRLEQDGGASFTSYRGFEVTGGVLVATSKTYNPDGGFGDQNGRCDWAELARAGNTVTFPDGISGVWGTFTNTICDVQDDGGCNNFAPSGYIPNPESKFPTRAGNGDVVLPSQDDNEGYTFVLYPQSCADLPGDAGAGVTP